MAVEGIAHDHHRLSRSRPALPPKSATSTCREPLDPTDLAAIKEAFTTYAVLIFPDQHLIAGSASRLLRRRSVRSRPRSRCTARTRSYACARSSPTSPISIPTTRSGAKNRGNACSSSATGCGIPTARSSGCPRCASLLYARIDRADRRPHRIRRRARGLRRAARRHESAGSTASSPSIRSSTRALASASPSSATRSVQRLPPVPQVLVRTIPESGRKSLYLASHAGRIFGMPEPDGRALIDELIAHATQRQFVYTHRWRRSRPRHVGQPLHHAPRHRLRRPALGARHAARHGERRRQFLRAGGNRRRSRLGRRHNVRVGHLADMSVGCRMSAFGGKADMTWTGRGADDLPLHQNCGHEF